MKKHRWCAWDSNPGPQDGRRRRNHRAMAATKVVKLKPVEFATLHGKVPHLSAVFISNFQPEFCRQHDGMCYNIPRPAPFPSNNEEIISFEQSRRNAQAMASNLVRFFIYPGMQKLLLIVNTINASFKTYSFRKIFH